MSPSNPFPSRFTKSAAPGRAVRRTIRRRLSGKARVVVGIQGRVAWDVLNPDQSVAQQGQGPNMILDRGLDRICTADIGGTSGAGTPGTAGPIYTAIRTAFMVGTSNAAPAAGQTTLGAEVARGASNGGFGGEGTTYVAAGGVLTATSVVVRALTFAGNYNLAEFGFSESSTTNAAGTIRELFRDGGNNPLIVSVQSGQQMKMTHTLTITIPWSAANAQADFTVTNLGVLSGKITGFKRAAASGYYSNIFGSVLGINQTQLWVMTAANDSSPDTIGAFSNAVTSAAATLATYVNGTFRRTKSYKFVTSAANFDHYGWFVSDAYVPYNANSGPESGFKFALTNPVKITKSASYELTLDFEFQYQRVS